MNNLAEQQIESKEQPTEEQQQVVLHELACIGPDEVIFCEDDYGVYGPPIFDTILPTSESICSREHVFGKRLWAAISGPDQRLFVVHQCDAFDGYVVDPAADRKFLHVCSWHKRMGFTDGSLHNKPLKPDYSAEVWFE